LFALIKARLICSYIGVVMNSFKADHSKQIIEVFLRKIATKTTFIKRFKFFTRMIRKIYARMKLFLTTMRRQRLQLKKRYKLEVSNYYKEL